MDLLKNIGTNDGANRAPTIQEAFIYVALENADQRNSTCRGDMLAGRIVADVQLRPRNLGGEWRERAAVSADAGKNGAFDSFPLADAAPFVDQNRRARAG